MFDSAVDGFGGTVAGADMIEVGQDVISPAFHRPAQRLQLFERVGDPVADGSNEFAEPFFGLLLVGVAVGGDNLLVDVIGCLLYTSDAADDVIDV